MPCRSLPRAWPSFDGDSERARGYGAAPRDLLLMPVRKDR